MLFRFVVSCRSAAVRWLAGISAKQMMVVRARHQFVQHRALFSLQRVLTGVEHCAACIDLHYRCR